MTAHSVVIPLAIFEQHGGTSIAPTTASVLPEEVISITPMLRDVRARLSILNEPEICAISREPYEVVVKKMVDARVLLFSPFDDTPDMGQGVLFNRNLISINSDTGVILDMNGNKSKVDPSELEVALKRDPTVQPPRPGASRRNPWLDSRHG